MDALDDGELAAYASALGVRGAKRKGRDTLVADLSERRERVATVRVFGRSFAVPMRRVRDKRVSDLLATSPMTDEALMGAAELLLGEAQVEELVGLCTEDDGTVDSDALAVALNRVFTSEELKN